MQRGSLVVTALAVVLSISPAAVATWMAYGSYEPSSSYDTTPFMFPDAGGVGDHKIYFDVVSFEGQPLVTVAFVNPNVGALQTRNEVANSEFHEAILGEWVDCNGDGYIGMAETAVREYSSRALLDTSVCPPVTGQSTSKWDGHTHNYNGWVSELIPISRNATLQDARVYRDDDAMVWGDYGTPDQKPTHVSCALEPLPRGTTQSTGGALDYVNCRARTQGLNLLDIANSAFDAAGQSSLDWSDHNSARSGPLGQQQTLGTEDSSKSPAHVWDCSSVLLNVGDTANQTPAGSQLNGNSFQKMNVYAPAPALGDTTDPTAPAFINETEEGSLDSNDGGVPNPGDCNTADDSGHNTYGNVEADFNGIDPENKHESDWNFGFVAQSRGVAPFGTALGVGNAGADGGGGVDVGGMGGSHWEAPSIWATKPGFGILTRSDTSVGPADAYWLSFYAHVGTATTSRGLQLPGGVGTYGTTQCGSFTSGIHMGWNCDLSTWYVNPDGTKEPQPFKFALPGQHYELRDVDCADGGNSLGVPMQPASLGTNPCT